MKSGEFNADEVRQIEEVKRVVNDLSKITPDKTPVVILFSISVSERVRRAIEEKFAPLNLHFTARRNAVMAKGNTY